MPVLTPAAPALPKPVFARIVRGSGPGLLLAHGAGGSVEGNYGPILDGLAARHRVVGADYPGTGKTPRSESPLNVDELADQLVAAADAEGLDTFAIAGFSLGGPIGIRAAVRHPERVNALVLTATFAHRHSKLDLAAAVWQRLYESGDRSLLAEYLTLVALSNPALNALTPDQLRDGADLLAEAIPPGTPEHTDLVRRIDVRDDLARITAPTLVISTTGDPLVSPALHRQLADQIPGARLAEIATGHLPFAERPEEWLELITAFLDEHTPHA